MFKSTLNPLQLTHTPAQIQTECLQAPAETFKIPSPPLRLEPIRSSTLAQSETLPPNHIKSLAQFQKCQNPHAIKSKPTPKYAPSEFLKPNLNQETTQPVRPQATNIPKIPFNPKYFPNFNLTPKCFQIHFDPKLSKITI